MKFKEMFSLKGGLTLIGLVFWFLVTPVMAESSGVFHTVVFWLKPSTPEKQVEKIIESIQRFEALPMVEKVIVGKPIMSDRAVEDDSFSIAFTMVFKDEASLKAYNEDPDHKKISSEVTMPYVSRGIIYDYSSINE